MTRIDMRRHHRLGFAAVLGLEGYCRGRLPKSLYELVKLRASHLNGCAHCIEMHTAALRGLGESPERIAALGRTGSEADAPPSPLFDDAENAALALTDVLTRIDPAVGVDDAVWAAAARYYDDATLGSLVLGIATINVWNRVNIAIRLDA